MVIALCDSTKSYYEDSISHINTVILLLYKRMSVQFITMETMYMPNEEYTNNEAKILPDFNSFRKIYVDIRFIKYIELGRLLAVPTLTEDQFTKIRNIVISEEFSNRHTDDIEIVFSSVPDIEKLISTKVDDSLATAIAPTFEHSLEFIRTLVTGSNNAKRICMGKVVPTPVILDVSMYNLSDQVITKFVNEVASIVRTTVSAVRLPLPRIVTKFKDIDCFVVSTLDYFNNQLLDELNRGSFYDKTLYSRRTLPLSKLPNLPPDTIDPMFGGIQFMMVASTRFGWIDPARCIT